MKNEVDSEPNRLGPDDAAEVLDLISTGYEPHVLAGSLTILLLLITTKGVDSRPL